MTDILDNLLNNFARLEKADLDTTDLSSNGGYLVDEQAAKFIEIMIKESVLMGLVTVDTMNAPKKLLETLRFGSGVLHGADEGKALPEAQRATPDLGKTELSVELFKAEVPITDEVFEDNIERQGLKNTIRNALAKAIARDLEDACLNGDTALADTLLGKLDGIRKQTTTNTADNGDVPINVDFLNDLIKTMPSEFIRNRDKLRFLTSINAEQDLWNNYSNRGTDLGDRALENAPRIRYSGIPLVAIPVMPENLGAGTNETEILLVDPKNIHIGILRKIKMEPDRDARAGTVYIIATVRADTKYEYEPASVKGTGITVS